MELPDPFPQHSFQTSVIKTLVDFQDLKVVGTDLSIISLQNSLVEDFIVVEAPEVSHAYVFLVVEIPNYQKGELQALRHRYL